MEKDNEALNSQKVHMIFWESKLLIEILGYEHTYSTSVKSHKIVIKKIYQPAIEIKLESTLFSSGFVYKNVCVCVCMRERKTYRENFVNTVQKKKKNPLILFKCAVIFLVFVANFSLSFFNVNNLSIEILPTLFYFIFKNL